MLVAPLDVEATNVCTCGSMAGVATLPSASTGAKGQDTVELETALKGQVMLIILMGVPGRTVTLVDPASSPSYLRNRQAVGAREK